MNQEQRQAYEWAKSQNYQSVAARYAKVLAGLVDEMTPPNEPLTLDSRLNANCGAGGDKHDSHRAHDLRSPCRVADTGRDTAGWYPPMEQAVWRTVR